MDSAVAKIQGSVTAAPIGAAVGAIVGVIVAKQLGYGKTLTVIGFTVVGLIIGSAIASKIKK